MTLMGAAIPVAGFCQTPPPLSVTEMLYLHAEGTYGPLELVGVAAYAGILQEMDAPKEWKQGAGAYGKRFAYGSLSGMLLRLQTHFRTARYFLRDSDANIWVRA
ncbi:MAG TPA: hypothetical protein VKU19_10695 [Bryobacteraceae bacterium]|nr:hypothetical protein [Bryobacteraceae bacterium]